MINPSPAKRIKKLLQNQGGRNALGERLVKALQEMAQLKQD
jgi:hypothetical protein